jgi:riboflavin biosynthesis pyrimidine reductase
VRRLSASDELSDFLEPYDAVARPARAQRPWVLANMVVGLDGSAAIAGRVGALSTPADARLFRELRSVADVVLVGAETVRRERYGPVRLEERLQDRRVAQGRPAVPALAVVSRSLDFDWSIPLFADAHPNQPPVLVTGSAVDADRLGEAKQHGDVLSAGLDSVDVVDALGQLRERGADVVLCEGGPTLLGELVARDVLDELCMTLTPVLGGDPLPLALAPSGAELARFDLAHALVDDGTLFLRYERQGAR